MKALVELITNIEVPSGWTKNTFNELFNFSGGLSMSREQLGKDGFCYLHYGDIHKTTKSYFNTKADYNFLPKLDIDTSKISGDVLLNDGDVVFVDASEDYLGASKHIVIENKNNIPFISGLHTIIAKSKDNSIYNDYKKYCFQTNNIRKQFYFYTTGIKVYGLSKPNISKLIIALPPTIEQEKIAEILSTCEKIIDLKEKLIAEKEMQQQWLMAKLLSPKKGWEFFDLGEVIEHHGGTALESIVNIYGDYNFISIGNYSKRGYYVDNGSRIDAVGKASTKILNKNDLVMVLNDKTPTGDIIGSTILIYEDNKYIYNQRSERIVCSSNAYCKYIWYVLNSKIFRKKVFDISQGGTQIYVNFSNVKKLKLSIPTFSKQFEIANILATADSEIDLLKKDLAQWKNKKIALMQLLLTGKVRTVANIS